MSTDVRAEDAGRWHNWPPENVIAWERACKETREAWRSPPQQSDLAILIRSDVPTKEIAALLHRLNAPLPEGKPGGAHTRWRRPHYPVAYLVEKAAAYERTAYKAWRLQQGEGATDPAPIRHSKDELISHWINVINGWHFMRDKPRLDPEVGSHDHERIKRLLREPRHLRL